VWLCRDHTRQSRRGSKSRRRGKQQYVARSEKSWSVKSAQGKRVLNTTKRGKEIYYVERKLHLRGKIKTSGRHIINGMRDRKVRLKRPAEKKRSPATLDGSDYRLPRGGSLGPEILGDSNRNAELGVRKGLTRVRAELHLKRNGKINLKDGGIRKYKRLPGRRKAEEP